MDFLINFILFWLAIVLAIIAIPATLFVLFIYWCREDIREEIGHIDSPYCKCFVCELRRIEDEQG